MKLYTIITNLLSRSRKFAQMSFYEEFWFAFISRCKYQAKVSQESMSFEWRSEEKKPLKILYVTEMKKLSIVERRAQISEDD